MGEFVGIRYGQIKPGSKEVEWHFLSHIEYDGIGAFAKLLRERGADIRDLPRITHHAPLSWGAFLRSVPELLAPRRRLKWQKLPSGDPLPKQTPTPAVAWHVFDEDQTAKIRRSARNSQVTVNSLLLKYLDRTIRPYLEDPSQANPWMVPVNMRGKADQPEDTGNHSSYVGIRVLASEGARDVQNHIYESLAKGRHCANWKAFDATRFTSEKMKHHLIRTDRATSQWNLGSFSNLGVWDAEKQIDAPECQGDWLFAPPTLAIQMLGAGCVTFRGKLSLTLHVHPDLTTSPEVPAEWMRRWVREIETGFPKT
ncbi:hypothetical protein OKA04_08385 [Luteolibacter flavescens]|uniref:Uncharacterized protein n=1 Tax=Luteolibacter flavescens TaxID=1859460 RepID=A0ABT3FMF7_9BACT|nr:hypothetical protein [Luteolibacter flavescens]MCW1884743.1 hypothetical protein [Luteolibacter flavescens]